jgi:aspartate carbamoyltransferase catalytic subunit
VYLDQIRSAGHEVQISNNLQSGIGAADILYVTRTQEERFPDPAEAEKYKGLFRLNQSVYTEYCEPNTVIMHPLPRDSRANASELDTDLNDNPNLAIFRQTDNGVLIRMALFALILDVTKQIDKHSRPVNWYTAKRF